MRVFVAINPTAAVRARLGEAVRELREAGFPIRWVPTENVHLTLKFLGEVPEKQLPELFSAVERAVSGIGTFEMHLGGFGAFPSLRRPSVVWTGVELGPTLAGLQRQVEDALAELGFPREERSFHPHLTLGRARKRAAVAEFRGLDELIQRLEYSGSFHVETVDVMRSRLMPAGAIYDVIRAAGLERRERGLPEHE
jgi:2'-5' RNA ligase